MKGGTVSYTYDGDGLRATKKTADGTTTYFLYDADKVLFEETYNSGTTTATATEGYGYAADGLRSRCESGTTVFDYSYDPQGNVVQVQSYDNALGGSPALFQLIYDGYGALRSDIVISTGTPKDDPDEVGFGGQYGYYTDTETGLILCTHRY